jgi:hypothetical protein
MRIIFRPCKKVFSRAVSLTQEKLKSTGDELDSLNRRILAMFLFFQLLFPALLDAERLIKFWNSTTSQSLRMNDNITNLDLARREKAKNAMVLIVKLLKLTVSYAVDVPVQISLKSDRDCLKWGKEVECVARDNNVAFTDFFNIISKQSSDQPLSESSPDLWMLEMWQQEWVSLYKN